MIICWTCDKSVDHTSRVLLRCYNTFSAAVVGLLVVRMLQIGSKSSQVNFIYIALLTIQIVSKHLTVSNLGIECQ